MACHAGRVGRLQSLRRPARIASAVVAVGFLLVSYLVSETQRASLLTAVGAILLVLALLLPVLTEFEVDVLGLRAKASLRTREQRLEAICRGGCRRVRSFVGLVGVDAQQTDDLVEEAIEDTCRLWRGPIVEETVGRLLVCRTAHLIVVSLRLGGPYRLGTPDGAGRYGPEWAAFVALDPRDRLIVALAEWLELDSASVAAILDLDVATVEQALGRRVPTGFDGASA